MRGLDDGPDGLNDAAFDRALGHRRPPRMTLHSVALERAQAVYNGDHLRVALCDVAMGRMPDVASLSPADALSIGITSKRDAMNRLSRRST